MGKGWEKEEEDEREREKIQTPLDAHEGVGDREGHSLTDSLLFQCLCFLLPLFFLLYLL